MFKFFKYKPSLSKKVGYAYYICLYLIVGVAVLNYFDLKSVENTVLLSDVISEFSDTTLEIRRFEKTTFSIEKMLPILKIFDSSRRQKIL